jgi:murein DD-endopeptidase MepM/ murein hydrolase activator NlpD
MTGEATVEPGNNLRNLLHALRTRLGLRTRLRRLVGRHRPPWRGSLDARVRTYFGETDDVNRREEEMSAMIRDLERDAPTGDAPTTLVWPVTGFVTSPFGERFGRMHFGVDIAAASGTPILAGASGRVLFAGPLGEYGNTTVIGHGGGVVTLYAHQRSCSRRVGELVARGDVVGSVGTSGRSTGPHLHFETRTNGTPEDPNEFYARVDGEVDRREVPDE